MSLELNAAALGAFRNVRFGNDDAIANLDGDKGIKQNGKLGSFVWKMFRSGTTEAANNAIRTELLQSLGKAFGLGGVSEAEGKVVFSKDFMDKLERILGSAFKRADFGIGDDGVVNSGKPLTQRRITAIVRQASLVGKTGFAVDLYRAKLDAIMQELGIAGLSGAKLEAAIEKQPGLKMFIHAEKALDFLKTGLFMAREEPDGLGGTRTVYGPGGDVDDHSVVRNSTEYQWAREIGDLKNFHGHKFEYRDPATGEYKPLSGDAFQNKVLWNALGGELIHTERAHFSRTDSDDVEPLKKYVWQTVQLFAQKMVDIYFEAKQLGKVPEFLAHLENPGACLEDKGLHLSKFQDKLSPAGDDANALSKADIAELERIANMSVGDNAPPRNAQDMIYDAIDALNKTDEKYDNSEDWNDFAGPLKEKLLGKTAQIVRPEMDEAKGFYEFKPVTDKNGKPVVRPLTAEDIDTVGKACLFNVTAL